ncbi:hypothetical protein BPAE_0048g00510 [Botrytis paeoniae]|uniref:RING-type domain-containing protein n=1 Tax=Botrytis paeoniae TaxID=278948 RepID=A0A4Z1FVZ6_9HELO|nr:hypothetical protein BPAE_0048g00510 [Botrytis paeoniae]
MDPNCCVVTETLSGICGHVTTVIEHHRSCELIQFDSYRAVGYDLKFLLDYHPWTKTRMASAFITESKCISRDAIEKGASFQSFRPPPNTWISDTEKRFDDVFETAQQDLIAYNANSGDAGDEQALYRLNSNVQRAETIRNFYDHRQNEYLLQFRGLKNMSMRLLFDPVNLTHLTFGLLRLVKPKEIPAGEVCGICREIMDGENRKVVMRLFCDQHLFHENCIIPWFETANNNTVICPICRTTREMYKPPNVLDHE